MKTKSKALLLALCAVLLVTASVLGTMAYLTSTTGVVTNTFKVGDVEITLDEAKVTEYGVKDGDTRVNANTYKLIPGHKYTKDPIIHVTKGSEECWLFVKVVDEIAGIEASKTVAEQLKDKGWALVAGTTNVYAYNSKVDARENAVDVPVFENFTIKGDAAVADYANKTITVQAYAVQADSFGTAAEAWTAAPLAAWVPAA